MNDVDSNTYYKPVLHFKKIRKLINKSKLRFDQ